MSPEFVLQILMAVIGAMALIIFRSLTEEVRLLRQSVTDEVRSLREAVERLNTRVAVVVERVDSHEVRLRSIEDDR